MGCSVLDCRQQPMSGTRCCLFFSFSVESRCICMLCAHYNNPCTHKMLFVECFKHHQPFSSATRAKQTRCVCVRAYSNRATELPSKAHKKYTCNTRSIYGSNLVKCSVSIFVHSVSVSLFLFFLSTAATTTATYIFNIFSFIYTLPFIH